MTSPISNQKSKTEDRKRPRTCVLLIIALAIALRIALAFAHPFFFPDSHDYDALARTIIEGQPYQVDGHFASRMPGYPVFIAAIYFLCGYSFQAVLIVQAFLGGATAWLVYLVGRRFGEHLAIVAAVLTALDPLGIAFSASLLSEVPFTFCLVAGLYCSMRLLDKPRIGLWFALALIWTAALQLRPEVLGCIVVLALAVIVLARNWRARALHVGGLVMVLVFMAATVIPWQNRSEKLFHARVHFTALEGISLYEAVYPDATGGPRQDLISLPADMEHLNEVQRNDEWSRRAWQYIRNDPARIGGLAIKKIARTWSPFLNASEFQAPALRLALGFWYLPLFAAAAIGLFCRAIPIGMKGLLLIPILYVTAVHALFLGSVRYRVPITPILCLLAAAGILQLLHRTKRNKPAAASTV